MEAYSFAQLLREARKHKGLTQKELAERVGLNDSYISRIERGVYSPPARDKILNIMDTLGITEKAERINFLLAAGRDRVEDATLDDLEGLDEATDKQSNTPIPPRHARFVFASPPLPEVLNTVGRRIERLIIMASLSEEEKKIVEERLVAVTEEILVLVKATKELNKNKEKN